MNVCVSCGKHISLGAIRCRLCAGRIHSQRLKGRHPKRTKRPELEEQQANTKDVIINGIFAKAIPLNHKKIALVDVEDYKIVSQHNWQAYQTRHAKKLWYARTNYIMPNGRRGTLLMHRLILGLKPGDKRLGDHENGNGLDNRRSKNLRIATTSQNRQNSRKRMSNTSSKYKGVSRFQSLWMANIRVNKKAIFIGYFKSEEDAARAYDKAALKYFGAFACLNFPLGLQTQPK